MAEPVQNTNSSAAPATSSISAGMHVVKIRTHYTRLLNTNSSDEIALYDRQIRLWGMQAQEKIRNANILLINVKALGNEIAKNLVLAGVGSLTIVDDNLVTEEDLFAQFFISESDVGTPVRSQLLISANSINTNELP